MSKGLLGGFASLFGSDVPRWACEFKPGGVAVVEASADRRHVVSKAWVRLDAGAIVPDLRDRNIPDAAPVDGALRRALDESGFSGSELVVVIPDDAVRTTLVETESFPSSLREQDSFIRWKLKKSLPFDVSGARVACQKLGENGVVEILAVLAPEVVVAEYESLVDRLGLHPGVVCPSTPAALNLLEPTDPEFGTRDLLFAKLSPTAIVTAVIGGGRVRFYRCLPRRSSIEEAVYPTLMYYEDKLKATAPDPSTPGIARMIVCSEVEEGREIASTARTLGLETDSLYPAGVEDIYKPALGALQR